MTDSLIDNVLPRYDVHERHELWVPGDPQAAYAAVKDVTAAEVKLLSPLMQLRTLGRWPRSSDPGAPLLEELKKLGFVVLGERPGEEIVVGAIGRFWSPIGNMPRRTQDFSTFDEPDCAKAVMNFTVRAEGAGSRITTETRIVGTDPASSRKFRLYWLAIRLGSGAIRRSWLRAIRRRLERTAPENAPAAP